MSKKDCFQFGCPACGAYITAEYRKVAENGNFVVCEECGASNYIDAERLLRGRQIIFDKVFGKRPKDPGRN